MQFSLLLPDAMELLKKGWSRLPLLNVDSNPVVFQQWLSDNKLLSKE